jgi:hypothetical protein
MSRTIHSLALQILTAGGLLGTSLILPATSAAQALGPERALLNHSVALATPLAAGPGAFWTPGSGSARTGTDEGARALLGRTDPDQAWTPYRKPIGVAFEVNAPPVNGEQALLGKWTEQ